MPYELWKVVHLAGVIALFASLGGLAALSLVARPESSKPFKVLHGVALGLIFLAGFGLLAKLGFGSPGRVGEDKPPARLEHHANNGKKIPKQSTHVRNTDSPSHGRLGNDEGNALGPRPSSLA